MFRVTFGKSEMYFQEVSGLDQKTQVIEYRAKNSKAFTLHKMQGLVKTGNVTLKKGVIKKGDAFWKWLSQPEVNTIKRSDIVIEITDESGKAVTGWTLHNAFPVKVSSTSLKGNSGDIAVETLELAYETLTINHQ